MDDVHLTKSPVDYLVGDSGGGGDDDNLSQDNEYDDFVSVASTKSSTKPSHR